MPLVIAKYHTELYKQFFFIEDSLITFTIALHKSVDFLLMLSYYLSFYFLSYFLPELLLFF